MKRCNGKALSKWVKGNGQEKALARILEKTGLAPETLSKMIRDKYPSELSFLVRKELVKLTKISEDKLFPEVDASIKAS